jgi:betaine-aldehyde dehydrogenase
MAYDLLVIGGELVEGAGDLIEITDPRDGSVPHTVAAADPSQVAAAIAAARAAQGPWEAASQDTRSSALEAIAAEVDHRRDEIVDLVTLETGRARARNQVYVDWTSFLFRQYAVLARHHRGRVVPSNASGQLSLILRVPLGVVACLVPYNYPLALLVHKAAPALATGNAIVVKGAPETTRTTLLLGEIMARHVPGGVVEVLAGGAAMVDGETDMVAFTGSTAAGRVIGARCGELVKPAHLELGGKDPAIVFADADLETAAAGVVWAAFLNTGQVCTSTERVYVDRSIEEPFVNLVEAATDALRVGDPFEPSTQVGPLRTRQSLDRVSGHVADAVGRGARILAGGERIERPGFWYRPTALAEVDHSMQVMRDETFGPVLPVMGFDDVDEAFRLAADTPYGLGASIYTQDPRLVKRAYETLRVGTLWVNDPVVDNPAAPFGGMRASGSARELGLEGLDAFTAPRHVHWDIDGGPKAWWYSG